MGCEQAGKGLPRGGGGALESLGLPSWTAPTKRPAPPVTVGAQVGRRALAQDGLGGSKASTTPREGPDSEQVGVGRGSGNG